MKGLQSAAEEKNTMKDWVDNLVSTRGVQQYKIKVRKKRKKNYVQKEEVSKTGVHTYQNNVVVQEAGSCYASFQIWKNTTNCYPFSTKNKI